MREKRDDEDDDDQRESWLEKEMTQLVHFTGQAVGALLDSVELTALDWSWTGLQRQTLNFHV